MPDPPSLDDLVERWGGWDKIPAVEWRRYDRAVEATQLWLRIHHKQQQGERNER